MANFHHFCHEICVTIVHQPHLFIINRCSGAATDRCIKFMKELWFVNNRSMTWQKWWKLALGSLTSANSNHNHIHSVRFSERWDKLAACIFRVATRVDCSASTRRYQLRNDEELLCSQDQSILPPTLWKCRKHIATRWRIEWHRWCFVSICRWWVIVTAARWKIWPAANFVRSRSVSTYPNSTKIQPLATYLCATGNRMVYVAIYIDQRSRSNNDTKPVTKLMKLASERRKPKRSQ